MAKISRAARLVIAPTRVIVAMFLAFASSCSEFIEPVRESNRYFSFFGALDVQADTQRIRVMAIRDSVTTQPGPLDAVVTLRQVGFGDVVELRDSAVLIVSPNPDQVADFHAHVYWTTAPILAGETYVVSARRSDGATATVTVPIPKEIASIDVDIRLWENRAALSDMLYVNDVVDLAYVRVLHHGLGIAFQHIPAEPPVNGTVRSGLSRLLEGIDPRPETPCTKGRLCSIMVTTSGIPWPFEPLIADAAVSHISLDNVENGTGVVVGINSATIPYESCTRRGLTGRDDYCRLSYNQSSNSLSGTVLDAACERAPLTGVLVRLEQVGGDRVRQTWTTTAGKFAVGALEAGSTYALRIVSQNHVPYEELLTFTTSESRLVEVELNRTAGTCASNVASSLKPVDPA